MDRGEDEGRCDENAANEHRWLRTDSANQDACQWGKDDHRADGRKKEQPRCGDRFAEAVAEDLGQLKQCGHQHERAEHDKTEEQRDDVRRPDTTVPEQANVDEGILHPKLDEGENDQCDTAENQQADCLERAPAPGLAFADRKEDGDQSDSEDCGAGQVEAPRRADGRLAHSEDGAEESNDDQDRGKPEQPVPIEVLHDGAGGDDAHASADSENRRQETNGDADPFARQFVSHNTNGEGQDSARGTLQGATHDQDSEVRSERSQHGADEQQDEDDDHDPTLADHVAEFAEDRRSTDAERR